MRHDVVPELALIPVRGLVVDYLEVFAQLRGLLGRDDEAELHLVLGEGEPEPVPGEELEVRREDVLHTLAGVAGAERAFINGLCHILHSTVTDFARLRGLSMEQPFSRAM